MPLPVMLIVAVPRFYSIGFRGNAILCVMFIEVTSKNPPHHIEKIAKCCIIKANEVRR